MKKIFWSAVLVSFVFLAIFAIRTDPLKNRTGNKKKYFGKTKGGVEEEPPRYDRPGEAMLEEIALRSEIGKPFSYPDNWRMSALKQARQLLRLNKGSTLTWIERGPAQVGGRTRSLVVDPGDQNSWWAGAVGGGIWHTSDAGQSWTCQSDQLPVLSVTTLAICNTYPDIIYAGTGEGFYNYDAIMGDGVFKTTDGGSTWQQLASTAGDLHFRYVNRIVVDPFRPDTLFAATNQGVYHSFDGGTSWNEVFSNGSRIQQIVANPGNFRTLFFTSSTNGIYKSMDLGQTWQKTSEEITNQRRIEIAVSAADTNFVYAAATNSNYGLLGLFKSTDGGQTWIDLGNSTNWLGNQGWYDNTLVVHPFNPQIVYVGGIDLYKVNTAVSPATVTAISNWYGGQGLPYVHADQHDLITLSHGDGTFDLIATNDGGVFFSPDSGVSWQARNNNYDVTQFYDADRHPFEKKYIGGTQDNGTNVSLVNSGPDTYWTEVIGGDGFDCAWDKSNPDLVYGTLYDSRVYKSINGGDYFRLSADGLPESDIFHTPLTMDPHNSKKLFTISDKNKIYITRDGAQSWSAVDVSLDSLRRVKIAVSEKDSNVVWAASSSEHINVSLDAGQTFTTVSKGQGFPDAYVSGLATSPFDSATALVFFGVYGYGKIFLTRDFGNSWQDLTHNLPEVPVHCGLIMPYDSTEIWIGTDLGLFISYDEGQSWNYDNSNLPAVSVRRLKIVGREIVAATHGRGVWSVFNDKLDEQTIPTDPPLLADLNPPNPNTHILKIFFRTRGEYDSIQVRVNGSPIATLQGVPAYKDTFATYQSDVSDYLEVLVRGFKDTLQYDSDLKTLLVYEPVQQVNISFDSGQSDFSGDMSISQETGFASPSLHTEHPYQDKREYIALLQTPVLIRENLKLHYKDVALVEPGEPGSFYPDEQMWDYVTVEASADAEDWKMVITPYDCRFNEDWQVYFSNQMEGEQALYQSHDTTLSDFFTPGQYVYFRFRLHADDYTHGWGWAIDDVKIDSASSTAIGGISELPIKFELMANYPNPFGDVPAGSGNHSRTTISYALSKQSHVRLTVYNTLGQKVRQLVDRKQSKGRYKVVFDARNLSSGLYFYTIKAGNFYAVRKMLLIR